MTAVPTLRTLGGLTLSGADPAFVRGTKRAVLLTYLAVEHAGAPIRRELLLPLFWPGFDERRARHALRNTILSIRKALGSEAVIANGREEIRLAPDALWCDAVAFAEAAAAVTSGMAPGVLELYGGPFLHGVCVPDAAPELEHWVDAQRARLHRTHAGLLDRLADEATAVGDHTAAARHLRALVSLDPLAEPAVIRLVHSLIRSGHRVGAARLARAYAKRLESDLGQAPGPQLTALLGEVYPSPVPAANHAAPPAVDHRIVGREQELAGLEAAWDRARSGQPVMVLIQGEAGVGKTRLAEESLAAAAGAGAGTARARSWAAEGRLAYGPLAELLRAAPLRPGLVLLDAPWQRELSRILPELGADGPDADAMPKAGWQRRRLFEAIARAFEAASTPLMVLIDDLQWSDEETILWLGALPTLAPTLPVLVVGTVRDDELPAGHPLHGLRRDLAGAGVLEEIRLAPLDRAATSALGELIAGHLLGNSPRARLYRETGGVPFYVVEYLRAGLLDRPGSNNADGSPTTVEGGLPPRVRAVLVHRLDHLSSGARRLAELVAVAGRAMTPSLLAAATGDGAGDLVPPLDELWTRRILREVGVGSWDFTHDRLRDAAYDAIPPARRADHHRRVAEALVAQHPDSRDAISGWLAMQWEKAGEADRAIDARWAAATAAIRLHAPVEAVRHLRSGLDLISTRPDGAARDAQELPFQLALGDSCMATSGWAAPEVGAAYDRAKERSIRLGDRLMHARALWGLQSFQFVRADLEGTRAIGQELVEIGTELGEPELLKMGRYALGLQSFHAGLLESAAAGIVAAMADGPREHRFDGWVLTNDLRAVVGHSYLAQVAWMTSDDAGQAGQLERASERAGRSGSPFSRGVAACYAAMCSVLEDDPAGCASHLAVAIPLCEVNEIPYYRAWAGILQGWVTTREGLVDDGIDQMRESLAAMQATGAGLRRPFYLGLIADAQGRDRRLEEALATLEDAESDSHRVGERWWLAELCRRRAGFLEAVGQRSRALEALEEARLIAVDQGATRLVSRIDGTRERLART